MKLKMVLASALAMFLSVVLVSAISAQEKKAEKKKAEKAAGDVGLLDLEKNYMILVTKEGKLITLDFDKKSKVTALKEEKAKMSDIGLGSSASIVYTEKGGKKTLSAIEYLPAKGGD